MPNVAREQMGSGADDSGSDGEVCPVDGVMAGKPSSAERSSVLSYLSVDRMPGEGREQRAGGVLLWWTHSSEHFQAGDLAGLQRRCRPLALENRGGPSYDVVTPASPAAGLPTAVTGDRSVRAEVKRRPAPLIAYFSHETTNLWAVSPAHRTAAERCGRRPRHLAVC